MAGCESCGCSTTRRKCRDCELAERYEEDPEEVWADDE